MLSGGNSVDNHANTESHIACFQPVMTMRSVRMRRLTLLTSLAFIVQLLAVSVCQMDGRAMAATATGHAADLPMIMDSSCTEQHDSHHAMNNNDSTPHSGHDGPCGHCNQPDELVSSNGNITFSPALLPLLYTSILTASKAPNESTAAFTLVSPEQPPGSAGVIFRISQRIRI